MPRQISEQIWAKKSGPHSKSKFIECIEQMERQRIEGQQQQQLWQDFGAKAAVLQMNELLSALHGEHYGKSTDDMVPMHVLKKQIERQINLLKKTFKSLREGQENIVKLQKKLKKLRCGRDELRREILELLDGMFGMPRSLSAIDEVASALEANIELLDKEIEYWAQLIRIRRPQVNTVLDVDVVDDPTTNVADMTDDLEEGADDTPALIFSRPNSQTASPPSDGPTVVSVTAPVVVPLQQEGAKKDDDVVVDTWPELVTVVPQISAPEPEVRSHSPQLELLPPVVEISQDLILPMSALPFPNPRKKRVTFQEPLVAPDPVEESDAVSIHEDPDSASLSMANPDDFINEYEKADVKNRAILRVDIGEPMTKHLNFLRRGEGGSAKRVDIPGFVLMPVPFQPFISEEQGPVYPSGLRPSIGRYYQRTTDGEESQSLSQSQVMRHKKIVMRIPDMPRRLDLSDDSLSSTSLLGRQQEG